MRTFDKNEYDLIPQELHDKFAMAGWAIFTMEDGTYQVQRIDDPVNWGDGNYIPAFLEGGDAEAIELAKKEGFILQDNTITHVTWELFDTYAPKKKFFVTVTEKYSKVIEVEAFDEEEASDIVSGMEINMSGEDYVSDSFLIDNIEKSEE